MKTQHIITDTDNLRITTGDKTHFGINKSLVQPLLDAIHEQKPKDMNLFGYLTELSARRGIFASIKEGIDNNEHFHTFVKHTIQQQFFPFIQVINLARNVFSHHMHSDLQLKQEDFAKQKDYLIKKNTPHIYLHIIYSELIPERTGSEDYGIHININFKKVYEGIKFSSLITRHQLYLLSELCYNISEIYRVKHL